MPNAHRDRPQHENDETRFVVGQDVGGRWLAIEAHNLVAGLFRTRHDALHFVALESGDGPVAIDFATAPLKLTF